MSAKPFGKLREQLEERPGGSQAIERARQSRDAEIAAYEAGLAELRRAHNLTQTQLARQLNVTQGEVSRIERRADLYLSTLQSYIEAMGGHLELVGVFDDARVTLAIGELVPSPPEDVAADDTSEAAAPAVQSWEVTAKLHYRGNLNDPTVDTLRAAILNHPSVTSDAVAIRRGEYADELDVSFVLEATDQQQAERGAGAAINSAVSMAPRVSRGEGRGRGGISVDLTAATG